MTLRPMFAAERDAALGETCPTCSAPPGQACRFLLASRLGDTLPGTHHARSLLAAGVTVEFLASTFSSRLIAALDRRKEEEDADRWLDARRDARLTNEGED